YLFISPVVDGWIFIISKAFLINKEKNLESISNFTTELSVVFDEAQSFANNVNDDYYHWIRSQKGYLIRQFAYSSVKKQVYDNINKYNLPSLEEHEDVIKVAESWSINPTKISSLKSRGEGYILELSDKEYTELINNFKASFFLEHEKEYRLNLEILSRLEQVILHYKKWSKQGFMNEYGLFNLALALFINNKKDESKILLEKINKENIYNQLLLNEITENNNILDTDESSINSYNKYKKAFEAFINNDNTLAIEYLIDAIDLNPQINLNRYFITEIFIETNDYANALENANKVLNTNLEDAYLLSLLVNIEFVLGDTAKALETNEILKNKYPYSVLYYCNKAEIFESENKFDEATSLLNEAITINANFSEIYALLGSISYLQGKTDEGINNFTRALQLDQTSSKSLLGLTIHYLKEENYLEAEIYAKKTLYYYPENDTAYNLLGRSYIEQDKKELALECFTKASNINEFDDNSLAYAGYIYNTKGMYNKAEEYTYKALAINETNIIANKVKEILEQHNKIESFEGFQYKFIVFMGILILLCVAIWIFSYLFSIAM
ncbi:MAG: tetratricopeptide repeat protein, partial [Vampirovibrionia bacterium]